MWLFISFIIYVTLYNFLADLHPNILVMTTRSCLIKISNVSCLNIYYISWRKFCHCKHVGSLHDTPLCCWAYKGGIEKCESCFLGYYSILFWNKDVLTPFAILVSLACNDPVEPPYDGGKNANWLGFRLDDWRFRTCIVQIDRSANMFNLFLSFAQTRKQT